MVLSAQRRALTLSPAAARAIAIAAYGGMRYPAATRTALFASSSARDARPAAECVVERAENEYADDGSIAMALSSHCSPSSNRPERETIAPRDMSGDAQSGSRVIARR